MNQNTTTRSGVRLDNQIYEPIDPWPFKVTEPATGQLLAKLIGGGAQDAQLAIDRADAAQAAWSTKRAPDRAAALQSIAASLRDELTSQELSILISRETGKRLQESIAEVHLAADYFDWFGTLIGARYDRSLHILPGLSHQVTAQALGVIAVITPWNFPVSIPARKIAPALAAGCALLFKPSEVAPLSALRFVELVEAHLPPGVLNTVIGEPHSVVNTWLADRRVRGLTFTGSTIVGRTLAEQAAVHFKRCVFELGGNAPFIVLDDADMGDAANVLSIAKYRNNGQSCIAANAAWIPRRHLDAFVRSFLDKSEALILGDPLDEITTLGPLALPSDPARIESLLAEAKHLGASVVRTNLKLPKVGQFCRPVVCIAPPYDARIVSRETFGPALAILPYDEIDEVIVSTRKSDYGLAAYVMGRDTTRAISVAHALDVGIVGVNSGTPNTPQVPFGGLKYSGIGVEGGTQGLDAFLTYQTVAYRTIS